MPAKLPIVVLISGGGTNLQALIDASPVRSFGCSIVGVISDQANAAGLDRAAKHGIPTKVISWSEYGSRAAFTSAIVDAAIALGAEALVLAGFMRILGAKAIERFPNAIINVHPSLLPAFPGSGAIEAALAAGVSETGVTVHFVDELVDHGPTIASHPIPIEASDDVVSLRQRIQAIEHRLLPEVVSAFGRGEISVEDTIVVWQTHEVVR